MKYSKLIVPVLLVLSAATAQAQMYKWVGPDGKITYSDVPPPLTAKQVETKSLSAGGPSTAGLPYQLGEAVRNSPVKLYTTKKCPACDDGRKLLSARGIPYTEKTVTTNDDIEQLRKLNGDTQLPVLIVGRSKQTGFESDQWNTALTTAGYPESNLLPKDYRNTVESAAPTPSATTDNQSTKADKSAAQPLNEAPPPPTGNAPPGFRF